MSTCVRVAPLSLLLPVYSLADSENASLARRYSLTGSVELSYDRFSSQGGGAGQATSDFRQLLMLDQRGYLSDPNLISYELSGTFSHDQGENTPHTTLLGEGLDLTLLHTLPPSWKPYSVYIPHPVWIRFSREDGTTFQSTDYGISFMHFVEPKQRMVVVEKAVKPEGESEGEESDLYEDGPTKTAKIVEKEREFPIPRTFFDYDHHQTNSQGFPTTTSDIANLRSTLSGKNYEYRFLFRSENDSGYTPIQDKIVQLEPIYRFFNDQTRQRIDLRNMLRYEERNGAQSKEANSSLSLTRPFGKDSLAVTGTLGYSDISAGASSSNYAAAASTSYTHQLSSRLANSTELSGSFTKTYGVENHSERLTESVTGDISRLLGGSGSAFFGNDSEGLAYGTNLLLFTKTRIVTSINYVYNTSSMLVPAITGQLQQPGSVQPVAALPQQPSTTLPSLQSVTTPPGQQPGTVVQQPSAATPQNTANSAQQQTVPLSQQYVDEKVSMQTLSLRVSGPLLYNLTFQTNADITLADIPYTGGIAKEQSESVGGNLLWRLSTSAMTIGGNYTQTKVESNTMSNTAATSVYATLSKVLPHNLLFNVYNSWTKTDFSGVQNGETTTMATKPTLRWTRGLTSVDSEYSYQKTLGSGANLTENRFFIRLVRKFATLF